MFLYFNCAVRSFVAVVEKILNETGLDGKYLDLEITESAAVRESDNILGVLEELRDLGIEISIDDFGTEYSSLSRLNPYACQPYQN